VTAANNFVVESGAELTKGSGVLITVTLSDDTFKTSGNNSLTSGTNILNNTSNADKIVLRINGVIALSGSGLTLHPLFAAEDEKDAGVASITFELRGEFTQPSTSELKIDLEIGENLLVIGDVKQDVLVDKTAIALQARDRLTIQFEIPSS
jgi:hypothetical protein